ncbi:roadblock/LC7 domain-containing protein [Pseudonocardia ailaonensis]
MTRPDLRWLLDDLVDRVFGVGRAVVLSADGLLVACSRSADDDAEHLSAVASAFHSLARSASRQFRGGPVQQTVVEMDGLFLFVTAAGPGACLAVLADAEADIGAVAYEMGMLIRRVGTVLSAPPRVSAADGPNG